METLSASSLPLPITRMDRMDVYQVGHGKFAVVVLLAPASSDDLWETVMLPVAYPNRAQAERKAAVIREAGKIDLARWVWTPSLASPYSFMHLKPSAKWVDAPAKSLHYAD